MTDRRWVDDRTLEIDFRDGQRFPDGEGRETAGERTVRLHPEPDGLALGKPRAYHVMSTAFWEQLGFGYVRHGGGEGHW